MLTLQKYGRHLNILRSHEKLESSKGHRIVTGNRAMLVKKEITMWRGVSQVSCWRACT